jgi:hypothetical protein
LLVFVAFFVMPRNDSRFAPAGAAAAGCTAEWWAQYGHYVWRFVRYGDLAARMGRASR